MSELTPEQWAPIRARAELCADKNVVLRPKAELLALLDTADAQAKRIAELEAKYEPDCYCVCHSAFSSRPSCEHCKCCANCNYSEGGNKMKEESLPAAAVSQQPCESRDPRVDPRRGDWLEKWETRIVTERANDRVHFARSPQMIRSGACSIERWRKWAGDANVLRQGALASDPPQAENEPSGS